MSSSPFGTAAWTVLLLVVELALQLSPPRSPRAKYTQSLDHFAFLPTRKLLTFLRYGHCEVI